MRPKAREMTQHGGPPGGEWPSRVRFVLWWTVHAAFPHVYHTTCPGLELLSCELLTNPVAQFIVPCWGIKSTMAWGCPTDSPAYVAWRARTTTLCHSRLFIPQSGTIKWATAAVADVLVLNVHKTPSWALSRKEGMGQNSSQAPAVSLVTIEFCNLSPAMGARNQLGIGLSYRPASLCSSATQFQTRFLESIPRPIAGLKFSAQNF